MRHSRLGSRIQTRRKGQPLTPPEEVIRRAREERVGLWTADRRLVERVQGELPWVRLL